MKENNRKFKRFLRYIPLILVIIGVGIGGWYWYLDYIKYIPTDDAHIDSDNVSVSSTIPGRIIKLYADEGDSVKSGDLLAELDSSDLVAQREHSVASKNQAITSKIQAEAKYHYDEENIKTVQVALDKSKDDFDRAKEQFAGEVITKESFDHSKKAFESAEAQLNAAKSNLEVSKSMISGAIATIASTISQINVIENQLTHTKIYAPCDGIIAKRWLLPGDVAQPGQSILTVNNNNKLWVIAYLEETKLVDVHIGQKTIFTIDAFPGIEFHGKVYWISSNSASQFSLIPPNNASGNFTKVTQRIPIKISIDGTENNGNISDYHILSGESVVIKIVK